MDPFHSPSDVGDVPIMKAWGFGQTTRRVCGNEPKPYMLRWYYLGPLCPMGTVKRAPTEVEVEVKPWKRATTYQL